MKDKIALYILVLVLVIIGASALKVISPYPITGTGSTGGGTGIAGTCAEGYAVQNTTTFGVECVLMPVAGAGTSNLTSTVYAGSDLSGTDATVNRTLAFTYQPTTVVVDSFTAIKNRDYAWNNTHIRFIGKKWDDQDIEVWYYE